MEIAEKEPDRLLPAPLDAASSATEAQVTAARHETEDAETLIREAFLLALVCGIG